MAAVLVLLLVVPIVEIYVLLQVGHAIGALATVGLLIAMSVLGAWLIKREGARAWRAFTSAAGSGRLPAREVADGALVLLGGALLLTPGFVSDVVGLLCILPPTRALLRRALMSYITRRSAAGLGWAPPGMRVRSYRADVPGREPRRPAVIDGEIRPPAGDPPRT